MYVFLSCTKTKADHRCKAVDMYSASYRFKARLEYALSLTERKNIFILSAKHHLLRLSDEIVPYKRTLLDMSAEECKEWAEICKKRMKQKGIDFNQKAVYLTGEKYNKYLKGTFSQEKFPLKGKSDVAALAWLNRKNGHSAGASANESLSLSEYLMCQLDLC